MKRWQKILLSVLTSVILCVSATGCTTLKWLFSPQEQSSAEPLTTVETVYAKAQELGFEGTLEEFLQLVQGEDGKDGVNGTNGKDGADGVGVLNAYVENGVLFVELTNGKKINCGVIAEKETHTVSFDANGGGEIPSQKVEHGEKATKPADPEKEGYVFDGWYVGEEKWSFIGYSVTEDITLTVKWTETENVLAGKKLSVMGDSISTFAGWSNDAVNANSTIGSNAVYYGGSNIISSVDDTWWKRTADACEMELLVNNSWSGSQVTTTRGDAPAGCMTRAENLHDNTGDNAGETPDIIAVYLGINDCNRGIALGAFEKLSDVYDEATGAYVGNTTQFASAYAMMIHKIKLAYPSAKVFCFTHNPNGSKPAQLNAYNQMIRYIADYFDCELVDLYNDSGFTADNLGSLTGDGLHPNAVGMDLISDCFIRALTEAYKE